MLYRYSALRMPYDEHRVRVLFSEQVRGEYSQNEGYEMDTATYHAIPYGTPATLAMYREVAQRDGHRAIIASRTNFDDLFTPAGEYANG